MVRQTTGVGLQSVRLFSRKTAEYPNKYKVQIDPRTSYKKDHRTFLSRHLKSWLGPKNARGEYFKNKYFYPPQDHQPRYIVQDGVTDGTQAPSESRPFFRKLRNPLAPFPENPHCTTASVIPNELKAKILGEMNKGLHNQQIAHKYGIKMERVDAISKLDKIRTQLQEQNKISDDMKTFSLIMYKMFPLFQPPKNADNLTEIPEPSRTLHQRFLTISESEPFGPVDAAKVYDLEPALVMLEKLQTFEENSESNVRTQRVLIAPEREGDRTLFKFTPAKSGEVGHRYGFPKRDRKKNRRVGYDVLGRMIYM